MTGTHYSNLGRLKCKDHKVDTSVNCTLLGYSVSNGKKSHYSLCNNPEQHISQLIRGGSLKSHIDTSAVKLKLKNYCSCIASQKQPQIIYQLMLSSFICRAEFLKLLYYNSNTARF